MIVRKKRKEGDFSHDARGHVCEECRCRKVAGSGTRGDFYGLGEHVGNYGVGFCRRHERGRNARNAHQFALNQMKALQRVGKASRAGEDYDIIVRSEALAAQENKEVRQGIELVQDTLQEFRRKCIDGEQTDLTELARGGKTRMSDKSRMELACKLATTIGTLAKDKFSLESGDYLHVDELKIRIPQMIALAYRFIHDEGDKAKFIEEFRGIWDNARTGVR